MGAGAEGLRAPGGGARLLVGTSGWSYRDWEGRFYPPGVRGSERLHYYARHFDAVEINASFYRFPTDAMIRAWSRVREGFVFALKGHRRITHLQRLQGVEETLEGFLGRCRDLPGLEVLLWQLPPSFAPGEPNRRRVERFLGQLPRPPRHAIEFRHPGWFEEPVARWLAGHGGALVAVSHPTLPDLVPGAGEFLYVRFHGSGESLYQYRYREEELARWAKRIRRARGGRDLYAFFNNDWHAHAVADARRLRALLGGRPPGEGDGGEGGDAGA